MVGEKSNVCVRTTDGMPTLGNCELLRYLASGAVAWVDLRLILNRIGAVRPSPAWSSKGGA